MEKTVIWKYKLEISDDHVLTIPAHAKILYLAVQNNVPCLWVQVNPYNKGVKRHFITYGTGHGIEAEEDDVLIYVGTYQLSNGFVGHVFEMG